ncbi:hypothetical protein V8C43DRAFT_285911 [Trichoderma afarasin]
MRPGIKGSLRICQLGKANKTERLFRGGKDGVSDVLLLTSAKEVSRTGKRQRCGLEVFALWGLFPSPPCPVCTFICALAPEASKGLVCYSLLCFVCMRRDEKGLVTNRTGSGCHPQSVLFRFAGLGIFCLSL